MDDYSAKLTGEPFLYNETKILASYILDGYNVEELKNKNITENLIRHKTIGSIKRSNSPIFRRLGVMNREIMYDFVNSDIDNSRYILVYAIMKTDKLVRDFVFDVYKDKLFMRKEYIEKFEIDSWYEEKCLLSENLKERSESTSIKLKQVIMKIMQDSGLVIKEKNRFKVVKPLLKDRIIEQMEKNGDKDYAIAIGGVL